jgi:DNA-binding beta-propeller fold protein YncE
MRIGSVVLLCALIAPPAGADAGFRDAPKAVRDGDKVRINFAADGKTDVEVAVLDAEGRVVRHLAAGVLGPKAPPPLEPGSLAQQLTWDGQDDAGEPVAEPGKCTVRVSLGLEPAFDRILGWKGEAIGEAVGGLAVGPTGETYVLNSGGKKPTRIYVVDREGTYVRMLMPYPADLPAEKLRGVGRIELSDDRRVPLMRQPICFALYPDLYGSGGPGNFNVPHQTMAVVGDRLVLSNAWAGRDGQGVSNRRLLILDRDGGVPENYLGPLLADHHAKGFVRLAPVAGEEAVYVTGLKNKAGRPLHVVYKVPLDEPGPPKTAWLGRMNEPGDDEKHFNDPRGLAVDGWGNVYVSDWGNNRIVVFDAHGAFLGQVAVKQPDQLAVHPRTAAIYVMQEGKSPLSNSFLRKLAPVLGGADKWVAPKGDAKVLASIKLRYGDTTLAVDGTAEPTVIWIGHRFGTPSLFRIVEKDGAFSRPTPTIARGDPHLLVGGFLAVDPRREEVYTQVHASPGSWESWPGQYRSVSRWVRIDGRTGRIERVPKLVGTEVAVAGDGHLIVHGRGRLARFARDGTPAPFPDTGTHVLVTRVTNKKGNILPDSPLAVLHGPAGHCVGVDGRIYVLYPHISSIYKADRAVVDVYGPDGKLKRKAVVRATSHAEGIGVDPAGNIYVADNVKRLDAVYPPEFGDKLARTRKWAHGVNWYGWYGAVLKFPPAGGIVGAETGKPAASMWGEKRFRTRVKGVQWMHTGIYPMPGGPVWFGCTCYGSRFGVDGFGRVFLPDVATFCVRVVDTNANRICRFGGYGNMESRGPGSPVPEPAIAFAWPQYVAVSDEAVYVSDVINRRIVRVKLAYRARKQCPVR